MKLIVQIPCLNEESTLAQTIAEIPRQIDGIDVVEVLVIDDGSTDETARVALLAGADHIVRHKTNKGLAQAFRSGIDAALEFGADIIVNTDADNQYPGRFIPDLIKPILENKADIVVGDRQVQKNPHFSWSKRRLQALGAWVVGSLSGISIPDAVSGFRAISREAAMCLNVVSPFSYTIETLIQAGTHQMMVTAVPIETNPKTRRSRLFRNIPHFIMQSLMTMVRIYTMYHPLRMFGYIGIALGLIGLVPIVRFLYFYFFESGAGHIQSLILGGVFLLMGFVTMLVALLADLINFNRRLIESTLQKIRSLEYERGSVARAVSEDPAKPRRETHEPAVRGRSRG